MKFFMNLVGCAFFGLMVTSKILASASQPMVVTSQDGLRTIEVHTNQHAFRTRFSQVAQNNNLPEDAFIIGGTVSDVRDQINTQLDSRQFSSELSHQTVTEMATFQTDVQNELERVVTSRALDNNSEIAILVLPVPLGGQGFTYPNPNGH